MEKKYKTEPEGDLLRIIALKDFADVKEGDKGGLIEKEENLSQFGDCWVYEDAKVSGNACVYENAKIYGNAKVFGGARVHDNTQAYGMAKVYGSACVFDCAEVCGNAKVGGCTQIYGDAKVCGHAGVYGEAHVYGSARISGNVVISGNAEVWGNAEVYGKVLVEGNTRISGNDVVCWAANGCSNVKDNSKNYVILATRNKRLRIFSSNIKDKYAKSMKNVDITGLDYIKNIQTIRQIYGEEV